MTPCGMPLSSYIDILNLHYTHTFQREMIKNYQVLKNGLEC